MTALEYYENYRTLAQQIALLESRLRLTAQEDCRQELQQQLDRAQQGQIEIEEHLAHYIPYALPTRSYFKALEEREFLICRCVKGLTMEQTANLLNVSRDTAYRIRRRIAARPGHRLCFEDDRFD